MSEARNQRFEIDIDEIERQLRRSVDAAPAPKADPLAELARIVGQDDPFKGILGSGRGGAAASNVHVLDRAAPPAPPYEPVLPSEDRDILHGRGRQPAAGAPDDLFDPVVDAYGSLDAAYAHEDLQPLNPRRSRGRLAAVLAALLVTGGAVAGGLYWRKSGTGFAGNSGAPPVVTADTTPLKVAPTNPGGVEVPNQNRQIYEKGSTDGQSRVVDGREQPIDVREAARSMPQPTVSARAPVSTATDPAPAGAPAPRLAQTGGSNAVSSVLGEPRRVRTVAVRPDGTTFAAAATTASVADPQPNLVPGNAVPPPLPVASIAIRQSGGVLQASVPSQPAQPAAQPTGPVVSVLPPARPRLDAKPARTADEKPVRTAALQTDKPEKPAAASGAKFVVQIAVRPTEEEARQAYTQLQDKYAAALDGRSARVTKAEVNGKTVHRVRVGPLSKDDADALCSRLKSSGGSCFVATN